MTATPNPFIFPGNPDNGDTTTNEITGVTYVYENPPGKWVVASANTDAAYVAVSGDTMTGPLTIEPSKAIPESARQASFTVAASPFSQFNDTQNYVSRVVEIDTNEGTNILSIRNNDAANLAIVQGKKSSINVYAAETSVFPSLSQVDPPAGGIVAGFKIRGRRADGTGGAASDLLTCTYFSDDNTQISYYGDITEDANIVTKAYVTDLISNAEIDLSGYLQLDGGNMSGAINWPTLPTGDALNVNSGNFVVTDTGKVTTKGSLTVQDSNLAINSGNLSVNNGIVNLNSSSTKGSALILYDYGNTNPNQTIVLSGMTGKIAMGSELWMYDRTSSQALKAKNQIYCSSGGSNVPPSYLEIKLGDTREGESDKTPFVATCDGVELTQTTQVIGPFEKTRGTDGTRDFVIYGSTNDNPTISTEVLFGTYRNTLNNTFQPDAIAYFGKTDGNDNIQTKTSVLDLIADNSLPSAPSFTDVTVTDKLQGGANGVAGSLEIDCYNLDVENRFYVPPSLQMFGTNDSTTFNLSSNDSIWFRSDDKLTNSAPTDNITGYVSNAGLAWMRPLLMFGGGVAGSDNPNTTGQNCKVEFNNTTSEYALINKTGYGQNGYQIFAATSGGTPVKMFNFLLSADGTKGYLNCYFKPQGSNGLVRLADLSTGVVGSINTYSVTGGEEGSDEATYHVSNHNIPGQCTFEGLPNGGSGFQLIGKTQGDPSNSSARLIATSHYSADQAAQIEYFGDTTGTDDCLQTKASVQAMLNDGFTAGTDLLVGDVTAVKDSSGAGPSLSIRNSDDTADVFKVASNGVVTLTNDLNGAHNIKFTGPNIETSSSQLIVSALGNNSNITHNVYDANGSPQRVTYMTKDGCNIYKPVLIAASLNVSNDAGITTSGPLKSTDNTPSGGIILDSGQTTSAIKVIGSSVKNFKIYIGYNANNTQQAFMCSKTQMYFGNGNSAMDYKFTSSDTTIPLRFNDGVSFVLNDAADPITFTQGKITNVDTISTTDSSAFTLMFNNTVGGPTFSQGNVRNLNYIKASDGETMRLQTLGGTSQQIILQTTTSNGDTYNTAVFDDTHAKLPGELDIYQNSGGTNGKIYSYGFSRGLEIWAADYNTAKGNAKLTSKFEASMVSFMTGICFDNTSAHSNNPSTDITIRVGTGAQGAAAAYPKIDFAWATDTGVTYEHNFTMEYTQFTNVPDVVLLSGSHVTQSSAPTNGNHLTNKTYVDNGTTNLTNLFAGIKAGVEAATDFDQLKSNILFALSSIS